MSKYRPDWDLSTIPQDKFASEHGKRNRAKQKRPNVKLALCKACNHGPYTALQRRKCPNCGHDERKAK